MEQRPDIGKYSSVKRIIRLWNQLPAEGLATTDYLSHTLKKRARKVIISEAKGFEA